MTRCAVCESIDDVGTDDRTAQPLCGSCRRLSLRELGRRLVWRATVDVADDRQHAKRVEVADRLADAMRRATLALCCLLLSACSAAQLPTAGSVLAVTVLLFLTVALLAAVERICAALNLSD